MVLEMGLNLFSKILLVVTTLDDLENPVPQDHDGIDPAFLSPLQDTCLIQIDVIARRQRQTTTLNPRPSNLGDAHFSSWPF